MSADSADHADCPERRRLGAGETARVVHSQRSDGCPLDRCPVRGRLALFGSASAWAGTQVARVPDSTPVCLNRGRHATAPQGHATPSLERFEGWGRPTPREVRFELPGCRSDEGGMPVKGCRLGGGEAACAQSGLLADGKGQPFMLCEVGEVLDVEGASPSYAGPMLDSVCSTRLAPTVRPGPCSMNEPVRGRLSDAPPIPM